MTFRRNFKLFIVPNKLQKLFVSSESLVHLLVFFSLHLGNIVDELVSEFFSENLLSQFLLPNIVSASNPIFRRLRLLCHFGSFAFCFFLHPTHLL